jgi:hypothetical protein
MASSIKMKKKTKNFGILLSDVQKVTSIKNHIDDSEVDIKSFWSSSLTISS